jgi:hypothetical protein
MIDADYFLATIAVSSSFGILLLILDKTIKNPEKMEREVKLMDRRAKRYEFLTNFFSMFHAIISWIFSVYILMTDRFDFTGSNTEKQKMLVSFSCGYFIFDTLAGLYYGYNDSVMNIHHFLTVFVNLHFLMKGKFAFCYVCMIFIGELTNPVHIARRQLSWFPNNESIDRTLGIIFCISFVALRGFFCIFAVNFITGTEVSLVLKLILSSACKLIRVPVVVLVLHHCQSVHESHD